MIDIERKVRKVSRALGVEVQIIWKGLERKSEPKCISLNDPELGMGYFVSFFGTPSTYERTISLFHEGIYRARARKKFELQKGICAICQKKMPGTHNTECDHIVTRGAHGRDDRLSNLQIVHGEPCHRIKHTKGK